MFSGYVRIRGVGRGEGGGGGGGVLWSSRFIGFLTLLPFWYYGMDMILLSLFLHLLSACSMLEVKMRLPLVRLGAEEGLARIRLLQTASSPL